MLAQKFLLETNLPEFLRLANKWDLLNNERRHNVFDEALDEAFARVAAEDRERLAQMLREVHAA